MLLDFAPLAAFIPAALVVTMTPGADTMLTIRNTARWGRRGGALTVLGILTGVSGMLLLVISGVAVLLTRTPGAFDVLKIAGALYLLWLAVQSGIAVVKIRRGEGGGWSPLEGDTETVAKNWRERFGPFVTGLITNVTNPKVLVFLFAFFPQFVGRAESATLQMIMLAALWIVLAIGWLGLVVLAVGRATRWVNSPKFSLVMESVSTVVFVLLAVVLLLPSH